MTIAAGFLCQDGSVICADTQETIGEHKIHTDKLNSFENQFAEFTVAITGAGDGPWIDMAVQRLFRVLPNTHTTDWGVIKSAIGQFTKSFFDEYIAPYAPNPKDRPGVDLLMVIRHTPGFSAIMNCTDNVLTEMFTGFDAIGTGALAFRRIAERLFKPSMSMREAAAIAIYVMNQVKEEVEGCGGNTDMLLIAADGKIIRVPTNRIKEIEIRQSTIEIDFYDKLSAELVKEIP